jgi:hypothetical protein
MVCPVDSWQHVDEQASIEIDPKKLMALVAELAQTGQRKVRMRHSAICFPKRSPEDHIKGPSMLSMPVTRP